MKKVRAQARNLSSYLVLIFVFTILNTLSVFAGPSRTTYQAKIVKPDGYPLEASSVNFKFTILDPAGSCILYSETYSAVNMSGTGGLISFALGSGVKTYPASATTFENVFSNVTPSLSCDVGGPANYSPAGSDTRKIVMQFHDGSGWQTLPAMSINAVPYAMYANEALKLNGKTDADFVHVTSVPTCAASEALRYNGAMFSCVATGGVTSSDVTTALGYTPANGASLTAITADVSAVSSTVTSVSSYASSVSATVTSLQNSVAASFAAITSSQWSTIASGITYMSGYVGVGTTTPVTKLDVSGGIRIGAENATCAASYAGTLRYNAGNVEYCNGSTWSAFGVSGAGLQSLNGSTSGTQSFGISTGGTAPNFVTANGVHTLNIPYASAGATTAGLISNTDYQNFSNKITSSAASIAQVLGYTPANSATVSTLQSSLGSLAYLSSLDLGSSYVSGTLAIARLPSFAGDVTSSVASNTLVLSNTGVTPGTYSKVTVDAKGRVTSAAVLTSADVTTALGYTPGNSSSGVTSLNGSVSQTQIFANGTSGNSPSFVTANGVHTLNIPYASVGTTTAGLISNADYQNFNNKITSSAASIAQVLGYVPASNTALGNYLAIANNLSDLASATVARTNLGLGSLATLNFVDLGSSYASGTLAVAKTPAYVGDVTKAAASNTLVLTNTGVTAGTYTKVTVDAKGRVTSSSSLASSDVTTALGYTPAASGSFTSSQWTTSGTTINYMAGNVGIGTTSPNAKLHIAAGTSSIAPLKLTSGTLLTSPQSGTVEYDGNNLYFTDGTNTRRTIASTAGAGTYDNASLISNSSGNITLYPNGGAGSVVVSATTASTSSNTGAMIVKGGLGIAGTANIGGALNVSGSSVIDGSLKLSSMTSGSVFFAGAGGAVTQDNTNFYWDNASKRLGIGTGSPADKLHVSGGNMVVKRDTNAIVGTYSYGAGVAGHFIGYSARGTEAAPTQLLVDDAMATFQGRNAIAPNSWPGITVRAAENHSATAQGAYIILNTVSNGTTSSTERMRIDSSGNVGIATSSPGYTLDVNGSIGGGNRWYFGRDGANMSWLLARGTNGEPLTVAWGMQSTSQGTVLAQRFSTSGTERMTIDNVGNIGMGTTSPGHALHVAKTVANGEVGLKVENLSATAGSAILRAKNQNRNWGIGVRGDTSDVLSFQDDTAGAVRMAITLSGNVGIGTTNPGAPLDVKTASATQYAKVAILSNGIGDSNFNLATKKGETTNNSGDIFSKLSLDYGSAENAAVNFHRGGGATGGFLSFATNNGSERVRIDTAGNVGIGTTNPTEKLEVNGNIKLSGSLITASGVSASTQIFIRGTGYLNSAYRIVQVGNTTLVNGSGRGLTLTILNKSNYSLVSSTNYDTYSVSADSDNLATALNNIDNTKIGILTSYDSWDNAVTTNLKNAFKRLGLTKAYYPAYRQPYAAIFEGAASSTVNTSKAVEVASTNDALGIYAEIGGWLVGGTFAVTQSNHENALYNPAGTLIGAIVDNNGYIGVGTVSPTAPVHAYGGAAMTAGYNRTLTVHANHPSIQFKGISDTNHSGGILYDAQASSEGMRFIAGATSDDVYGTGTHVMSLQANGRVGIGTMTPDKQLTIHSTGLDNYIHLTSSMTGTTASDGVMIGTGTAGDAAFYNRENTNMIFLTNNTERVRIGNTGNVGIGTTTPGEKLQVSGTVVVGAQSGATDDNGDYYIKSNGQLHLQANQSGSADTSYVHVVLDAGTATSMNSAIIMNTKGVTRMKISDAGQVTTPSQTFFEAKLCSTVVNPGGTMVWETVISNIGSAYNALTGKFTAPVAGVYTLGFNTLLNNAGSGEFRYEFYKNGSLYNGYISQKAASVWETMQGTITTYLNAGDEIWVQYSTGSGATYTDCSYNRFWGRLGG